MEAEFHSSPKIAAACMAGYCLRRNFDRKKPYIKGSSNQYYLPNYQRRNYNKVQNQNINKEQKPLNRYAVNKSNQYSKPQGSKSQNIKKVNPLWHEHREYRERRGIFEHVEGFGKKLGISLRSCILRAICEIKTQLLPEGESFINDVARIFFTIPTNHENKDDDFVQMALEDNVDCVRRFMVSCPHSPLRYFFDNFRATNMPPMSEQDMMRNLMYA
ncbi:uncharacterized protein LOC129915430 [Episyrphus balteatus]|uniref:uncharacterized protein LOC129915430 n=1 Tax=Episyrphus balteatus TaxID=286459 RepID=UPI0024863078|nr:uncharacterized protein LOC129915430 [Episyrphus balteatus]